MQFSVQYYDDELILIRPLWLPSNVGLQKCKLVFLTKISKACVTCFALKKLLFFSYIALHYSAFDEQPETVQVVATGICEFHTYRTTTIHNQSKHRLQSSEDHHRICKLEVGSNFDVKPSTKL